MDMPAKLEDWATKKPMAYLATHSPGVLLLDTTNTAWLDLLRGQSLAVDDWTTVKGKSHKHWSKSKQNPARNRPPPIPPINKESPETELETAKASPEKNPASATQLQQKSDNSSKSSSVGAPSVLLPNSKVPMNDGTNRITFRWKASIDFRNVSSQSSKMNEEIYTFLNEIFADG
jgi:hypothetical protein